MDNLLEAKTLFVCTGIPAISDTPDQLVKYFDNTAPIAVCEGNTVVLG
jgi:hypothetical protein